jgi:hypothetical protein
MSISTAFAVIAVGAILKWAVTAHVSWIDLQTTGTVLFVIGVIALPLSLVYTFYWTQRTRGDDDDRPVMRPPPGM